MLYPNRMEMFPLQLILQNIINSYQQMAKQEVASADALNKMQTFSSVLCGFAINFSLSSSLYVGLITSCSLTSLISNLSKATPHRKSKTQPNMI